MTTRNPLSYRELAKTEASVKRVLSGDDLIRLSQAAVAVGATHAEFSFATTEAGQPKVITRVETEATVACQWCLEPRGITLKSDFEAVLAQDESEAKRWEEALRREQETDQAAEIIVAGQAFDPVWLIEDELLLNLPSQVCVDNDCPDRPARAYGQEEGVRDGHDSPFAALEVLKEAKAQQPTDTTNNLG